MSIEMTKVMLRVDEHGAAFYDCLNHSGDHDVCTIMSALSNVLVAETFRAGYEPTIYNKGHVRIDVPKATYPLIEVFRCVEECISHVAEQNPDNLKVY